jgi:hypothetical protein
MVNVLPKGQSATAQAVAIPVEQEVVLLRGFRDLVAERWGYFMGRRLTQQEMNEKTEAERKAVAEIRKTIVGDNLKRIIAEADIKTYESSLEKIKEAREALNKVAKPYREKISPLAKAQRYMDNVAIPDALKELGTPVQPRFSLSKWISDAIASAKKKKKE